MKAVRGMLLCALLALTGAASAEDEARGHVEAAEALLKAKDYEGAMTGFEKALALEAENLLALRGRAEALLGAGKKPEAIAALHAGVHAGEMRRTVGPADAVPLMEMRRRLATLDPASAEVETLLGKHADALAAIGAKFLTKDPAAAEGALQRALRVQPDHAAALDRLGRIQRARAGKKLVLFNGRNFRDWSYSEDPVWSIQDGVMQGDVLKTAMLVRSNKRFDGDMEIVVEARAGRTSPDVPVSYGVQAAYEGDDALLFFGVLGQELVLTEIASARKDGNSRSLWATRFAELDPPFKVDDWHAFTITLEPTVIRVALDGKQLASVPRPRERRGGYIALLAQGCTAQFRKVEVTPQ